MNDGDGFKKRGAAGLGVLVAAVALASWSVWAFFNGGNFGASGETEFAFDGWVYDREAQRAAGAALAAAGLNDYRWEDGKLSVPGDKKGEYQTALATAGAFPKAPSEFRRDAIREIGAFESEAKTRMRELDACAYQLERTLERLANVEYATVGVRARREQVGLVAKTVVTASIGVACKKGLPLNLDAISAITVAAKHQLGVEKNENVSIIDLVEGKSYFGTEKSVGSATTLAYFSEKERVEKYWRAKFLETFDYVKNARISVAVDLRFAARSTDEIGGASKEVSSVPESGADAKTVREAAENAVKRATNRDSAAGKLATNVADVETIARPEPLATVGGRLESVGASTRERKTEETANFATARGKISGVSGAFAKLGNPNPSAIRPVRAENLASSARGTSGGGRIRPASFVETPELADLAGLPNLTPNALEVKTAFAPPERSSADETAEEGRDFTFGGEPVFEVRSLVVRIAIPRRYVRLVAQSLASERSDLNENADFAELYRETEADVLDETKRVALKMLRPIQERNRWSDAETENWVDVSVFSDVETQDDVAKNTFRYDLEGDAPELAVAETENWRVFGNFADVSERVADEAEGTEPITDENERADGGWKVALESVDWSSPFIWAVIAGGVAVLLAFGGVGTAAIRKRRRKNRENRENREIKGKLEATRDESTAQNKRKRKKETAERTNDADATAAEKSVETPSSARRRRSENASRLEKGENDRKTFDFDEFCSELEADCDDDMEIAAFVGSQSENRGRDGNASGVGSAENGVRKNVDSGRRREALDFVSRNPEQAASALRNWIKPGV